MCVFREWVLTGRCLHRLAQMAEHQIWDLEVTGSTPVPTTKPSAGNRHRPVKSDDATSASHNAERRQTFVRSAAVRVPEFLAGAPRKRRATQRWRPASGSGPCPGSTRQRLAVRGYRVRTSVAEEHRSNEVHRETSSLGKK